MFPEGTEKLEIHDPEWWSVFKRDHETGNQALHSGDQAVVIK